MLECTKMSSYEGKMAVYICRFYQKYIKNNHMLYKPSRFEELKEKKKQLKLF